MTSVTPVSRLFFAYGSSIVPAWFVEKTIFFFLHGIDFVFFFIQGKLSILGGPVSGLFCSTNLYIFFYSLPIPHCLDCHSL